MVFLTGPTQKSSKYGTGPPQQEKMTKYTGPIQDLLTQKSYKYGTWNFIKRNCLLKTLLFSVSYVGPVYLVIFSCWGGPVPYLELFWVGPVKKTTLY